MTIFTCMYYQTRYESLDFSDATFAKNVVTSKYSKNPYL